MACDWSAKDRSSNQYEERRSGCVVCWINGVACGYSLRMRIVRSGRLGGSSLHLFLLSGGRAEQRAGALSIGERNLFDEGIYNLLRLRWGVLRESSDQIAEAAHHRMIQHRVDR